tara:strand:+ start:234 stop:680 length:447 start_codon:yes stop_codon:yes gene_type:complete
MRLPLLAIFFLLQSCSNTLIGEKLENSFDLTDISKASGNATKKSEKLNGIKKNKPRSEDDSTKNKNKVSKIVRENSISNKGRLSQKSTKKIIFNPQPYRIIIRLSGANPSAPAETVTEALRKAGVQFEVEKIERFDEDNFSKSTSLNR